LQSIMKILGDDGKWSGIYQLKDKNLSASKAERFFLYINQNMFVN
jgi:hypothetical protein